MSASSIRDAGVFDEKIIGRLWKKCRSQAFVRQFSNTDNMALVGVLSTQLLHQQFVAQVPKSEKPKKITTDIDQLKQ